MPLRPTPDALRERAFAVLGEAVNNARFLDLFAGTGSVGLEALSRGAGSAVFVERHRSAARLIRHNCVAFGLDIDRALVLVRPALAAVKTLAERGKLFDLAWADPPFASWQEGLEALAAAFHTGLLKVEATACLECPERAGVEACLSRDLRIARDLTGGASRLVMIEKRG
jgi:16S rRNA (guanine(966)-N(2))-methyltransferase RsmD